jgi:hypothetical protein
VLIVRFSVDAPLAGVVRGRYRPAPDGQRFLVLGTPAREAEQPAAVVPNWTAALPQR